MNSPSYHEFGLTILCIALAYVLVTAMLMLYGRRHPSDVPDYVRIGGYDVASGFLTWLVALFSVFAAGGLALTFVP